MKKRDWAVVLVCAGLAAGTTAWAAWSSQTGDLPETDVRSVVPSAGRELLAATARRLYRFSPDAGSWKSILSVRASDDLLEVFTDPSDDRSVWAVTRRSIRHSGDRGGTWKTVFRRDSEGSFQLRCAHPDSAGGLWVGTTQGLYRLSMPDQRWVPAGDSPKNTAVDFLVRSQDKWTIGTGRGIYEADLEFKHWNLLEGDLRREDEPAADPLAQFSVEEISLAPPSSHAVAWPMDGRVYVSRKDGLYERDPSGEALRRVPEAEGFRIRRLASDARYLYAATDRGVYRFEPATRTLENISEGLDSLDVRTLAAEPGSGVWAATPKGVFRLDAVEAAPAAAVQTAAPRVFEPASAAEPSVADIQAAAVRYAEVSPDKIESWRRAAARKAWLPTVSLDTDFGQDQNVDIDRGGTNDPDKFIVGPRESSTDWSVGVSWDLGDLVWNDDQTSIDVRSRLMVELRNDILNDVTHLYFERRRLQLELAAIPADVPKLRIEKELKLQELTAQIDALTGGYLSRRLEEGKTS